MNTDDIPNDGGSSSSSTPIPRSSGIIRSAMMRNKTNLDKPDFDDDTPSPEVDDEKAFRKRRPLNYMRRCLWNLMRKTTAIFANVWNWTRGLSGVSRMTIISSYLIWKVLTLLVVLRLFTTSMSGEETSLSSGLNFLRSSESSEPFRILHIVTSLAEINTGRRQTIKGQDRLQEVLIPVLKTSVESMLSVPNWTVDVYLVLGFDLKPHRKQLIREALPDGVGLEVWSDATPLGYDRRNFRNIQPITRCLARQHRFVLKDKLHHYDFFTVFEDDMLVTHHHIQHFLSMSDVIQRLKQTAPAGTLEDPIDNSFHGALTVKQLDRLIPGFIRVEVLKPGSQSQEQKDPIPIDHTFTSSKEKQKQQQRHIDPNFCCSVPRYPKSFPQNPQSHQLMVWETGIKGLSVRQLPSNPYDVSWVAFQPGPKNKSIQTGRTIGSFWSGQTGAFQKEKRPTEGDPQYFGQQGGFMASKSQIQHFERICPGKFLPPFERPYFKDDGLFMNNVEFYSGGWQLFGDGNGACNLQRFLSLKPEHFEKHLLYHTANNKQMQIGRKRRVLVDDLFGQLNAVRKMAEEEMKRVVQK